MSRKSVNWNSSFLFLLRDLLKEIKLISLFAIKVVNEIADTFTSESDVNVKSRQNADAS